MEEAIALLIIIKDLLATIGALLGIITIVVVAKALK